VELNLDFGVNFAVNCDGVKFDEMAMTLMDFDRL
jgi:hypothetical protein